MPIQAMKFPEVILCVKGDYAMSEIEQLSPIFFFIAVIVFVNIILSDRFLHDSENEWFDDREAMVTY